MKEAKQEISRPSFELGLTVSQATFMKRNIFEEEMQTIDAFGDTRLPLRKGRLTNSIENLVCEEKPKGLESEEKKRETKEKEKEGNAENNNNVNTNEREKENEEKKAEDTPTTNEESTTPRGLAAIDPQRKEQLLRLSEMSRDNHLVLLSSSPAPLSSYINESYLTFFSLNINSIAKRRFNYLMTRMQRSSLMHAKQLYIFLLFIHF